MLLIDWLFRNRTSGRITIAQFPNAALGLFLAASLLRRLLDPAGSALGVLAAGGLLWWADDELTRDGESPAPRSSAARFWWGRSCNTSPLRGASPTALGRIRIGNGVPRLDPRLLGIGPGRRGTTRRVEAPSPSRPDGRRIRTLGVDAFAVGVAVGVVADEVGVDHVGQLSRQRRNATVGADRSPPLVGVVVPGRHRPIFSESQRPEGQAGRRRARSPRCSPCGAGQLSAIPRPQSPPIAGSAWAPASFGARGQRRPAHRPGG